MSSLSDPRRWARVQDLFAAALPCLPNDREALLGPACGEDVALRAEVEALLAADAQAGGFLAGTGRPLWRRGAPESEEPPERIGPYRIERELGRGGMGTVYLAARADGEFRQRVAVKSGKPIPTAG